ncbi:hypothetical protein ASA1KI_03590 [Opitutales bacterium ASA1]|nr:hypothetical protein ASA1KI_03590 [Opitutales bacterium ASA1]
MAVSIGRHDYVARIFVVVESDPVKKIQMSSALVFFRKGYLSPDVQKAHAWEFSLNLEDGTTAIRSSDGSVLKVQSSAVLFYDDRKDGFAKLDDGFSYAVVAFDEERLTDALHQYAKQIVLIEDSEGKAAQPGATDNPDDAQRLREDH